MGKALLKKIWRLILFFFIIYSSFFFIGFDQNAEGDEVDLNEIFSAEEHAVEWLKEQIVPNEIVDAPVPDRRRLILSYRIPPEDPVYRYVYSRTFIYDNALGIIALTMAGEYREAEYILGAMARLLREDGSYWFAYNTHNSWPTEDDHEGSLTRMGAIAWVGYACTFYLQARLKEDENYLFEDRFGRGVLDMAESIAGFVLESQVLDSSDLRYGLVTGGRATYELRLFQDKGTPIEEYNDSMITWVSTEHNIDIYFFLRDLHRITGNTKYRDGCDLVKRGLIRLWSKEHNQFFRGIKGEQIIDGALPLDCASWASIFLFSIGEELKARRCLSAIEEGFVSVFQKTRGYKPYSRGPIYEDDSVNRYYCSNLNTATWDQLDIIWVEGSLGVAAAYRKSGNSERGLDIIASMIPLRNAKGFIYSTHNVPYQFNNYPSVASTAWYVIAVETTKESKWNSLFWGK